MADPNIAMQQPIPLPVMGMTAKEYEAAFMSLDHANFAHEVEEFEDQRRRGALAMQRRKPLLQRSEFWATFLGFAAFFHAVFVQWGWPPIMRRLQEHQNSTHHGHGGFEQ